MSKATLPLQAQGNPALFSLLPVAAAVLAALGLWLHRWNPASVVTWGAPSAHLCLCPDVPLRIRTPVVLH